MKLLLDTNTLLWTLVHRKCLSSIAIDAIEDEANDVFVSVVSVWEVEIKAAKGKLEAPTDLQAALATQGFEPLGIAMRHAYAVESLPRYHRDPFDRMLVAQAQVEKLTLITSDRAMRRYSIPCLSAT